MNLFILKWKVDVSTEDLWLFYMDSDNKFFEKFTKSEEYQSWSQSKEDTLWYSHPKWKKWMTLTSEEIVDSVRFRKSLQKCNL